MKSQLILALTFILVPYYAGEQKIPGLIITIDGKTCPKKDKGDKPNA